ncbi:MAG: ACT domain-containing protein [Chloroflexota bacterium]
MAQTVNDALKQARLYSDDQNYAVISLPPGGITAAAGVLAEVGEPFAALIVDKDEVTLVIPEDALDEFGRRLPGHRRLETAYCLLTLDVELEPALVGFMARVSAALAEAGISILPFAAHTRDHLLVPADQFDKARATLEKLRAEA